MLAILTVLASIGTASGAYCHGKPHKDAKPNLNPIYTADPVFARKYQDGAGNEAQLFIAGQGDDKISVVHIWADSPYNRGYVHG